MVKECSPHFYSMLRVTSTKRKSSRSNGSREQYLHWLSSVFTSSDWLSPIFTSSDWLSPLTSGDNLSAHVP